MGSRLDGERDDGAPSAARRRVSAADPPPTAPPARTTTTVTTTPVATHPAGVAPSTCAANVVHGRGQARASTTGTARRCHIVRVPTTAARTATDVGTAASSPSPCGLPLACRVTSAAVPVPAPTLMIRSSCRSWIAGPGTGMRSRNSATTAATNSAASASTAAAAPSTASAAPQAWTSSRANRERPTDVDTRRARRGRGTATGAATAVTASARTGKSMMVTPRRSGRSARC